MAKDNKITVMPKVKSDFDKFSRTEAGTPAAVIDPMPSVEEPLIPTVSIPAEAATETVKGTATFNRGGTMPDIPIKVGADILHVECLTLFRKLIAGGYITPWALPELTQVDRMIAKLKDAVEVK